jgi:hypothetical protein
MSVNQGDGEGMVNRDTSRQSHNRLQEAVMVIGTLMPWVKVVSGVRWRGIGLKGPKGPISYEILLGKPVGQHPGRGGVRTYVRTYAMGFPIRIS